MMAPLLLLIGLAAQAGAIEGPGRVCTSLGSITVSRGERVDTSQVAGFRRYGIRAQTDNFWNIRELSPRDRRRLKLGAPLFERGGVRFLDAREGRIFRGYAARDDKGQWILFHGSSLRGRPGDRVFFNSKRFDFSPEARASCRNK